jgi:hypothetical protein
LPVPNTGAQFIHGRDPKFAGMTKTIAQSFVAAVGEPTL